MQICVLKEKREYENRVAATPETVKKMVAAGHKVTVEKGAGNNSSFSDQAYQDAGAKIASDVAEAVKGADVTAFDVRRAAKEQVESLGASFVEVDGGEDAETTGGYAKETSKEYQAKQTAKIHESLKKSDIAITTALIPGKPAPKLITEAM